MEQQQILQAAAAATDIISADTFSFAEKVFDGKSAVTQTLLSPETEPLVNLLTEIIYQQCYCREFDGSYAEFPVAFAHDGSFAAELSRCNSTRETWDKDWYIDQLLPSGQYLASKNGKYRTVYPGEFITAGYQSAPPSPGTRVNIFHARESTGLQPVFYFAFGNEANGQQQLFPVVRFYWNIRCEGAAKLVELVTRYFNEYLIPFSFKCLNNPSLFTRSDAAVLYIGQPNVHMALDLLRFIYPKLQDEVKPAIPWFSKRLEAGFALAEDPGTGQSFGISRCGMVAKGLLDAYRNKETAVDKKMLYIRNSFENAGIRLETPWLNPGSTDTYLINN